MKSILSIITIACCFIITAGCSSQVKDFTERKLIIASNQTVKIKELDLSITNHGCGRKWLSEGDNLPFERPYCDLVIKCKDSSFTAGEDFNPVYFGSIEITVDKMNPWGRLEDSIPPGGCQVWVRRVEGR